MGSPVSKVSIAAIRSPRASIPSAILLRILALARAARPGHGPLNASVAAATALPMSSASPAAARAYTRFDTGSATSNVAPLTLGTCLPPMKCSILSGISVTGSSPIIIPNDELSSPCPRPEVWRREHAGKESASASPLANPLTLPLTRRGPR